MVLLVYVHGYNLSNSYLQPFSLVHEKMTTTTFLEYWLANGLFRFRIPMLFIISGYLFAMGDQKPYSTRINKRLKTLGIPYLIWSAVGLIITFILQQFNFTKEIVMAAQLDQLGDNRPYTDIGLGGVVLRWLLVPICFQLWFIRNLLIYNIAYPLINRAILKIPYIWFSLIAVLWLATAGFLFIEGEGLLFFSLGVLLQKKEFSLSTNKTWLSPKIWAPVFILTSIFKTILAFKFQEIDASAFIILSLLHKLTVFSGLVAAWYGFDWLIRRLIYKSWYVWISAFSFFIYALHVPLINYLTMYMHLYYKHIDYYRLLGFILLPLSVIIFCIMAGFLTRKFLPKIYAVATGGRGML